MIHLPTIARRLVAAVRPSAAAAPAPVDDQAAADVAPAELPAPELIEAAAAEYQRAADAARAADRGKRAARKVLDLLPAGRYGLWSVYRVETGRQSVDLDEIRATYKRLGLGPVPMKSAAPSLRVERVACGRCESCDQLWPLDELGEDANGDPQCGDCKATHAGETAADAAAYRAYAHAGR